eukprot:7750949-Ditylum_brightwellii.AAC.1
MRDGVVDEGVYGCYVNELIHYLNWPHINDPKLFTQYGLLELEKLLQAGEGFEPWRQHTILKQCLKNLLQSAIAETIIKWKEMTLDGVMSFISEQADQFTGKQLSPNGYATKRSAIVHLVRCHNLQRHSKEFDNYLSTLWKEILQ